MPQLTPRIENLIRHCTAQEDPQLRLLKSHLPTLEKMSPSPAEVHRLFLDLSKVFEGRANIGSHAYKAVCTLLNLEDARDPAAYYDNLERIVAFAQAHKSTAADHLPPVIREGRMFMFKAQLVLSLDAS